jgi:threonine aldolase
VVSITQSTEMGTLYTVDEIARSWTSRTPRHEGALDGARLANATVALGVDVRQFTVDVG